MAETPQGRFIDHHLARGAVRVITGEDRPLKRKARRFLEPEPKAAIDPPTFARWLSWDGS